MIFNNKFRALFRELDISQADLARNMGVHPKVISKIINDEVKNPTYEFLQKMKDAYPEINLNAFVSGEDFFPEGYAHEGKFKGMSVPAKIQSLNHYLSRLAKDIKAYDISSAKVNGETIHQIIRFFNTIGVMEKMDDKELTLLSEIGDDLKITIQAAFLKSKEDFSFLEGVGLENTDMINNLRIFSDNIYNSQSGHYQPNEIDSPNPIQSLTGFVFVPRFDVVASCGPGTFNREREPVIEEIPFKEEYIREKLRCSPDHLILLRAEGDSMSPLIKSGDHCLVNLTNSQLKGDGVYCVNFNGILRIKKLQLMLSEKKIKIRSINPEYEDEYIDESNQHEMNIVGQVIWVGKSLI